MTSPAHQRSPWERWDVLTTPMTRHEADRVAAFIESQFEAVDAIVSGPGRNVRMIYDRTGVQLQLDAFLALRATGVAVPQGLIDDLAHWLEHVADPE